MTNLKDEFESFYLKIREFFERNIRTLNLSFMFREESDMCIWVLRRLYFPTQSIEIFLKTLKNFGNETKTMNLSLLSHLP